MRDYGCCFSMSPNLPNGTGACWSMLNSSAYPQGCTILIDRYTEPETEKYIKLIVDIVNKIQPCKLTTIGEKTYIAYERIGMYNNDLVLLNFIRNLWNEHRKGYSVAFFEKLDEIKKDKKLTPFEKLCTANVHAIKKVKKIGNGDHSNCHEKAVVKKLTDSFYKIPLVSTASFFCSES